MQTITLKYKQKEFELKFTVRAIALIEKEFKKPIGQFISANGAEAGFYFTTHEIGIMIKHALVTPVDVTKDDDFSLQVLEENPGAVKVVSHAMITAYSKLIVVAEEGNSQAQGMNNTSAPTSGS
jgi:hypothetical protein